MKLKFHGGAREVGKSCIELVTNGDRYILDAGLKFKENGFEAPFEVFDLPGIDGLFLSHAHLDHTGALPLFEHYNMLCPIFTTEQTRELTKILLKDSFKIARIKHLHPAYQKTDLKKVYSQTKTIDFDKEYTIRNIKFRFLNAGHIPGSAMILLEFEGKKLLYTGDFKLHSTQLMVGAEKTLNDNINTYLKNIDVLITESTYGNKDLQHRLEVEEEFLKEVEDVLKHGSVIIPVFGLGRAQELLILLSKKQWTVPIFYDGMCIDVTKKVLSNNNKYLRDRKTLQVMFKKAELIKNERKREKNINKHGIFITTSGMIQGGPIIRYLQNMWGNVNDAVFLTGYQCKRTNGRTLLEEGYVYLDGWKTYPKCMIKSFSFSGHADMSELQEFIKKINPKVLIVQHGDDQSVQNVMDWAEKTLKIRSFGPQVGEEIELFEN